MLSLTESNFVIASRFLQHVTLSGVIMGVLWGSYIDFATSLFVYATCVLTAQGHVVITAPRVKCFVIANYIAAIPLSLSRYPVDGEGMVVRQLCLAWQFVLVGLYMHSRLHITAQVALLLAEIVCRPPALALSQAGTAVAVSALSVTLEQSLRQSFALQLRSKGLKSDALGGIQLMDHATEMVLQVDASTSQQNVRQLHLNFLSSDAAGTADGMLSLRKLVRPTDWESVRACVSSYAEAAHQQNVEPLRLPSFQIRSLGHPRGYILPEDARLHISKSTSQRGRQLRRLWLSLQLPKARAAREPPKDEARLPSIAEME